MDFELRNSAELSDDIDEDAGGRLGSNKASGGAFASGADNLLQLDPFKPRQVLFPDKPAMIPTLAMVGFVVLITCAILVLVLLQHRPMPQHVHDTPDLTVEPGSHLNIHHYSKDHSFAYIGDGNCVPNCPQRHVGNIKFDKCRAACAAATNCIGFDWDAKYDYCRIRFATNQAAYRAAAEVPHRFKFLAGDETHRVLGKPVLTGLEGSDTAACFQRISSLPFRDQLSSPATDGNSEAWVGPLPNIFEYYEKMGLQGMIRGLRREGLNLYTPPPFAGLRRPLLMYNGTEGAMILPSVDAKPLLLSLEKDSLSSVTLKVGINSDSFNRGLGVIVEGSPQIDERQEHGLHEYEYNSFGLSENPLRRNVIKFHPNMEGTQLRNEGPGGWGNTDCGFTAPGWSKSGGQLNVLEVMLRVDGNNAVVLRSASGSSNNFRQTWKHKLFDGTDIPTLYAFMDLGGEPDKPLYAGPVYLGTTTS